MISLPVVTGTIWIETGSAAVGQMGGSTPLDVSAVNAYMERNTLMTAAGGDDTLTYRQQQEATTTAAAEAAVTP